MWYLHPNTNDYNLNCQASHHKLEAVARLKKGLKNIRQNRKVEKMAKPEYVIVNATCLFDTLLRTIAQRASKIYLRFYM